MKEPRRNTTTRYLPATVILASLTFLLAGCLAPGQVTSTPTGEKVDAALQPYFSQVLTWVPCGDGAECTTARAPLDWDNPRAVNDISLALSRHRATGTALGSLFVNPGGPGASGYDFVHDDVDFAASATLQANYDVIGWDPRGVGRSAPVTCYNDAQLDDFIYGIPDAPFDSAAYNAAATEAAIDFGEACLARTGPVLEFVDTPSTVRDLDLLRALVGDETLNYLGYSYGSDIGMYYIDTYPEKVGRVVLDGATDSTVTSFDVSLTQSVGFERALKAYIDNGASVTLKDVRGIYDTLDATPIEAPDGRKLDGGVFDVAMSMALYSEDYWPELDTLFEEVAEGETEQAFYLADAYYGRDESGEYLDNSLEAFLAISCLDYPVETDPAVIAHQNAELRAAAPTTARTTSAGDVLCANWPFSHRGAAAKAVTGEGAAPVLIVSTTGDPATPYEWGVALSKQLESAHLVTFNGEGHTAYGQGNECVVGAVDDYFTKGTVPDSDPDC